MHECLACQSATDYQERMHLCPLRAHVPNADVCLAGLYRPGDGFMETLPAGRDAEIPRPEGLQGGRGNKIRQTTLPRRRGRASSGHSQGG